MSNANRNNRLVMRICSAYKTCRVQGCRHKRPHECENRGMHRFSTCYDGKKLSACLKITDGTIPVSRWETCAHCGHSEFLTKPEPIAEHNATGDGRGIPRTLDPIFGGTHGGDE